MTTGESPKSATEASDVTSAAFRRRDFLGGTAVVGMLLADPSRAQNSGPVELAPIPTSMRPAASPMPMLALNGAEEAFLSAAVDTLIPADSLSPAASEVGIVLFIDRQLAGAWGAGSGHYRDGPFRPGTPEQGDQSPLTPRQFFATGIARVAAWVKADTGRPFEQLNSSERASIFRAMEGGTAQLDGFDGRAFFEMLLQLTMEGFFADPAYGGNRDMAGWRMLGFPGLPAFYAGEIASHVGIRYDAAPQSMADFT